MTRAWFSVLWPFSKHPGMFEPGQISLVELNHGPGMCVSQRSQKPHCTRPPRDSVFPLFLCEQNCSCEVSVSNHRTVCLSAWSCELWEPWVRCDLHAVSVWSRASSGAWRGTAFQPHSCSGVPTHKHTHTWLKIFGMTDFSTLELQNNEWVCLQTLITNRVCKLWAHV